MNINAFIVIDALILSNYPSISLGTPEYAVRGI